MTKEELSVLKKINKEIELIQKELNSVEPDYTKDSVVGSDPNFPYIQHSFTISGYYRESYERKVQRIQNRLNRKLQELMDEKDRITEYIYSLDDSDLRQILMYKYVNGLTWEEIGTNMGYAAITVRVKHDKFIKKYIT